GAPARYVRVAVQHGPLRGRQRVRAVAVGFVGAEPGGMRTTRMRGQRVTIYHAGPARDPVDRHEAFRHNGFRQLPGHRLAQPGVAGRTGDVVRGQPGAEPDPAVRVRIADLREHPAYPGDVHRRAQLLVGLGDVEVPEPDLPAGGRLVVVEAAFGRVHIHADVVDDAVGAAEPGVLRLRPQFGPLAQQLADAVLADIAVPVEVDDLDGVHGRTVDPAA